MKSIQHKSAIYARTGTAGTDPKGTNRVLIKEITPVVDCGQYPAKGTIGEPLTISADIFADGHDLLVARVLIKEPASRKWIVKELAYAGNDRWEASLLPAVNGFLLFKIQAWISPLKTWFVTYHQKEAKPHDRSVDRQVGIQLLEEQLQFCPGSDQKVISDWILRLKSGEADPGDIKEEDLHRWACFAAKERISNSATYTLFIDRPRAAFSTWYELFPRSCAPEKDAHGTLSDVAKWVPKLAAAGFDVLYLPPIHPIGKTKRKGRNNSLAAAPGDPGSPWAIGAASGGHTAIHPQLGNLTDLKKLIRTASGHGMEIALDIALQCAPDHPYIKNHPEWFRWRPDGSVQYAENPPKKYEDIIPFDFDCAAWPTLWEELKGIFLFWIRQGIRIFRVDNPHTKSMRFWAWLLDSLRKCHPDVILLSEAFTRPKVMTHLAMIGFTQSYTYFTWRNSRQELETYLKELTHPPVSYYFRPNFWPNTPDILPEHLIAGGENMHIIRFILAATLSANCGIYGPVFERTINFPAPGVEEYADNEKYEIKHWDTQPPSRTWKMISLVNGIRKRYKALQTTSNIRFLTTTNDNLIAFLKWDRIAGEHLIVIITLDPHHAQSGWLDLPRAELDTIYGGEWRLTDLVHAEYYVWSEARSFIMLDPNHKPAHILSLAVKNNGHYET